MSVLSRDTVGLGVYCKSPDQPAHYAVVIAQNSPGESGKVPLSRDYGANQRGLCVAELPVFKPGSFDCDSALRHINRTICRETDEQNGNRLKSSCPGVRDEGF